MLGDGARLVHRLDRDTAGPLVVAKDARAAAKWTKLVAGKAVRKEYEAVCLGVPVDGGRERRSGKITTPILKDGRPLPAETEFRVLADWTEDAGGQEIRLSLVRLVLGTGRTHQIRIHLASVGAPIAGDDRHGDFALNRLARKVGIRRLQLRAARLKLPVDGGERTVEASVPPHFHIPPEVRPEGGREVER